MLKAANHRLPLARVNDYSPALDSTDTIAASVGVQVSRQPDRPHLCATMTDDSAYTLLLQQANRRILSCLVH